MAIFQEVEDELTKHEADIDKLFSEEPLGIQDKVLQFWKQANRCTSKTILLESKDQAIPYKETLNWVKDKEIVAKLDSEKNLNGKYTGTISDADNSAFGIGRFVSTDGLTVVES